jgi:hypothetical protein
MQQFEHILARKKWLLQHEFRNGLGVQTLFA